MQKLKILFQFRRCLHGNCSFYRHGRSFSALPSYAQHDYLQQEEVLVEGRANSRTAILNRPSALNALTASMATRLNRLYESWEDNSNIGFVMMKGGSCKAFCSGTDVVALYKLLNEGKIEECKAFIQSLYKFVYALGTYYKPHVAIMDGIVMGGGAGVSLPGMFRVVTDKTVFSYPEVQIGFHPDAGASYYLSRLPGYLGEYLALTGEKLTGVDMMACGLATHYSLKEKLPWIEERLGGLVTDDRSVIENSLAQYGSLVYPEERSVLRKIETIDSLFSYDTVEEIVEALENKAVEPGSRWYSNVLDKIKEASPLSLKVALQSIREGRFQTLDKCLEKEYRASLRFMSKHASNDFCEGVRARLIDKDFTPKVQLKFARKSSWKEPHEKFPHCHWKFVPEKTRSPLHVPTNRRYFTHAIPYHKKIPVPSPWTTKTRKSIIGKILELRVFFGPDKLDHFTLPTPTCTMKYRWFHPH